MARAAPEADRAGRERGATGPDETLEEVRSWTVLESPVGRVRAVGMVEAVSFLVLLCVAMPLKYLSDAPELGKQVVFWVGLVHGILFIGYAGVAFWAWRTRHLSGKMLLLAAVASVVPL